MIEGVSSYQILEKCDPHYYSFIKSHFISEDEFNKNEDSAKKVKQTQDQSIASRLFWVAKNPDFTDLERRIYWYFYAKLLKADTTKNFDYLMLYYYDVVRDFTATLNVQKKDIYKGIGSLKKKRLLKIKDVDGRKIFVVTISGPVDMLTGSL